MQSYRDVSRRRRMPVRGSTTPGAVPRNEGDTYSLLQEWRWTLIKMERDAALHGYGEVQMLVGTATLAVEDLIKRVGSVRQ